MTPKKITIVYNICSLIKSSLKTKQSFPHEMTVNVQLRKKKNIEV